MSGPVAAFRADDSGMGALPAKITALVEPRDGVLTRAELLDAGVSEATMRWQVSRMRWRILLPGVILLAPEEPNRRQQLIAAQLYGGPGAVVGGPAAARFHGVRGIPDRGPVHVLVPRSRTRRVSGWADIRPTRLEDPFEETAAVLRVSSAGRAVVDAARWAPTQDQATAWVIEAVQREIVTAADLTHWLLRMNRRNTARARRAISEASTGAWSLPEAELLGLLRTSTVLPPVWPNPVLERTDGLPLVSPDAWLDDVGMAIMVHSREFHEGAEQWDVTVSRDGELTAAGVVVVGVTPHALRSRPTLLLDRIERTCLAAAQRPRPSVRAIRRERQSWARLG